MKPDAIATLIGFAIRSGQIVYGADQIYGIKKVKIVFIDQTAAENTRTKLVRYCNENGKKIIQTQGLELLVNKTNCKVIGLTNKNMSSGILDKLETNENYRLLSGGDSIDC